VSDPARFVEKFGFPGAPTVAYNVIYLDEQYSIEYDCGEVLGITNVSSNIRRGRLSPNTKACRFQYCIHILSRKPTMPASVTQTLVGFAERLGLNDQQLEFKMTVQDGCQYER